MSIVPSSQDYLNMGKSVSAILQHPYPDMFRCECKLLFCQTFSLEPLVYIATWGSSLWYSHLNWICAGPFAHTHNREQYPPSLSWPSTSEVRTLKPHPRETLHTLEPSHLINFLPWIHQSKHESKRKDPPDSQDNNEPGNLGCVLSKTEPAGSSTPCSLQARLSIGCHHTH